MKEEIRSKFPRWMQELARFQALKSQFYLYGNIYDCYYFPLNHHDAESVDALQWARFNDISHLLAEYFDREGYNTVCYYDVIDGLRVHSSDKQVSRANILQFISAGNDDARQYFDGVKIEQVDTSTEDALQFFRYFVASGQHPVAGIVNFASRFASNPNNLSEEERRRFLRLIKAAQEARPFPKLDGRRSILVLLCDKLNDIPSWLLLENPLTKGIEIEKPNKEERARFFDISSKRFFSEGAEVDPKEAPRVFPDLTENLSNRELEDLITISRREKIHVNNLRQIVDLFKYGTKQNFWEDLEKEKIDNAHEILGRRVKGQQAAIDKCVEIIRRAKMGLNTIDSSGMKSRPKGVVFFAGPTGVGKTELAKSMAELIYNSEDAIVRFDMSEYNDSNSDVKLIGAPPGYVGYEEGGQLTSQLKSKPFSIVLFDEIEKAHPIVFDKFLQILDDGRLTDGKGETVYFSESLIVFTSNLGMYREDEHGRRVKNVDYHSDSYEEMKEKMMSEIRNFFNSKLNRPEILNRFGDNFVVFDFIKPDVDKLILMKGLNTIQQNLAKQKNWTFDFDEEFVEGFRQHYVSKNLHHGGRGINNAIESHIKNGITNFVFSQDNTENMRFRAKIDSANGNQVVFECVGG